jgi:hypothetical protein
MHVASKHKLLTLALEDQQIFNDIVQYGDEYQFGLPVDGCSLKCTVQNLEMYPDIANSRLFRILCFKVCILFRYLKFRYMAAISILQMHMVLMTRSNVFAYCCGLSVVSKQVGLKSFENVCKTCVQRLLLPLFWYERFSGQDHGARDPSLPVALKAIRFVPTQVQMCARRDAHDWRACAYAHSGKSIIIATNETRQE